MDWRTIPGFMPQAIPSMQQPTYTTSPHTAGGWTTTTHATSIAFQQPSNVALPSQGVGYANGFGGTQQFKKAMVPGVQFGRPLHSAYAQGPMPIVHRKPNPNSSPLLAPSHDVTNHNEVDSMHSLVSVKSEASDIIELWESKGRGFPGVGHGPPWLQGPGRVTIKSEPVDVVDGNPWDTAKSVPAFPSNLPTADNSNWHPVSEVSPVPLATPPHYTVGYSPDTNPRVSCSKKDAPNIPLNLPYASANMGMNHGLSGSPSTKTVGGMAINSPAGNPNSTDLGPASADQNKMKGMGGANVKCGNLDGIGPTGSAQEPGTKRKKEKKGPPIPCKQCGKEFSKSYMKKHIRSHAEMKPYVCATCGKVFYSAPLLAEHESAFHDEEKKHQCYVCGHRFHQKSLLKEHLKSHVEKPYKCRVCPRSFSRRIKLNNHEKLHEGAQLKQCDVCGKLLKGRLVSFDL